MWFMGRPAKTRDGFGARKRKKKKNSDSREKTSSDIAAKGDGDEIALKTVKLGAPTRKASDGLDRHGNPKGGTGNGEITETRTRRGGQTKR